MAAVGLAEFLASRSGPNSQASDVALVDRVLGRRMPGDGGGIGVADDVRSFDGCLGRIPERPGARPCSPTSSWSLAGLGGAGGLFAAIAIGVEGHRRFWNFDEFRDGIGVMMGMPTLVLGMILLAPLAAWLAWRGGTSRAPGHEPAEAPFGWRAFAAPWWAAFRLVPLLAIGIMLILMASVLTPDQVRFEPRSTTLPANGGTTTVFTDSSGTVVVNLVDAAGKRTFRLATPQEIAEVTKVVPRRGLAEKLGVAALTIVTILVHGAALVRLGAALGTWIRSRRAAIIVSLALALLLVVGWPLLYLGFGGVPSAWSWMMSSLFPAVVSLAVRLDSMDSIDEIAGWVAYWDLILLGLTAIVLALSIRTLVRRVPRKAKMEDEIDSAALQPAVGEIGSVSSCERVGSK